MASSSNAELPAEVADAVSKFEAAVADIEVHVRRLRAAPWAEMVNSLGPLESARMHLMVAYTVNTLFYMYLKTQGHPTANHPVREELERVKEYIRKVKQVTQTAEKRTQEEQRQITLNAAAASRFITAALASDKPPSVGASSGDAAQPPESAAGVVYAQSDVARTAQEAAVEQAQETEAELRAMLPGLQQAVDGAMDDGDEGDATKRLGAQLLGHARELGLLEQPPDARPTSSGSDGKRKSTDAQGAPAQQPGSEKKKKKKKQQPAA